MADGTQAEQRVGETIAGKYQLTRLLGSGGMGAVYQATHQFTQRRVAVKLMHPQFARSGVAAERFVRESQAPSTIGHPGIVEVLDGGYDTDNSLYLVLELLEGCTLQDEMAEGRLDPMFLGTIMLGLLDALAAAHAADFVHRDIKPENIFLVGDDDDPRVKLLDFGVAGVLATDDSPNLTAAGSVLGTPLYMSPEQAKGRPVDARSDLWSVGAVMYQALTGRPPFGGDSFQALVVSIVTEDHFPLETLRPDLPVHLTNVIERALTKDVDERWQSAEEMAQALREALDPKPQPTTMAERPGAKQPELNGAQTVQGAMPRPRVPPARPVDARPAGGLPTWFYAVAVVMVLGTGAILWKATQRGGAGEMPVAAISAGQAEVVQGEPEVPAEEKTAPEPEPESDTAAETENETAAEIETGTDSAAETAAESEAEKKPSAPTGKGLDGSHLAQVLAQHQGELQQCYERAMIEVLMKQPELQPKPLRVDVALDVSAPGRVRAATLSGTMPGEMGACCKSKLLAWRFPAADRDTELAFPVVFQPTVVR